ncbi:hypothetical protein NM688_g4616 [Phlebia brevispora]|uniref:Uncharacterized protein n=1 Tax=Phlebia brevispora TaxID=194682 RepID=A0ACC1T2E4_9APHY|nr:hypothetical protein NM688_g4616 [Phlebia brevispora]
MTPPPLTAPIPQRAVHSEMQRIRLQMAADQAARLEEAEARRPDYLKRTKRPTSSPPHEGTSGDQENTRPSLGVVDSPVKGRRLALFQETSEESFEQSLLAGGYPLYGHSPTYADPTTPVRNGKTLQTPTDEHNSDAVPSEKELAKQRRLAAFRDHNTDDGHAKLYPVLLEGMGRVLMDHIPPDSTYQTESPHRKKGSRKRKGQTLESPAKRILGSPSKRLEDVTSGEVSKPNWPDKVFPWSLQSQQRAEYVKKEEEERLRWIERYLDRDSDEDDDNEDQSLGLPHIEEEVSPVRRGRGKMVPLRSNPHAAIHGKREHMMIPSDPADARAALLSKRSVRALAFRRRQEDKEMCICNGAGEGRELVQCDECRKWFHLECIGINDVTELGREEDPWYCNQCLGVDRAALSSPTFVPTDDRLPVNGRRDLVFFPGNVQESPPGMSWSTPSRVPKTPVHGKDLTRTFSTRSSMGDSSQFGPETPSNSAHSVRVYSTPGPPSFLETLDEPFDPTSTPSRGMKFSGPFTTPKAPSWYRGNTLQTPSLSGRKFPGGSFPYAFEPGNASSPSRNAYTTEESPVRRSTKALPALRPPESPLAPRSTIFPVFGTQASRRRSAEKLHG